MRDTTFFNIVQTPLVFHIQGMHSGILSHQHSGIWHNTFHLINQHMPKLALLLETRNWPFGIGTVFHFNFVALKLKSHLVKLDIFLTFLLLFALLEKIA